MSIYVHICTYMRPDLSEELIKRVAEKWKRETGIVTDIPTSKIIEDVLLRYIQGMEKVRNRKRDMLLRKFLKMKDVIKSDTKEVHK